MHINEYQINPDYSALQDLDTTRSKWRRRGKERRNGPEAPQAKAVDYVEKRTSGDRRSQDTMLKRVSKIIFPRGRDSYDF